MSLLWLILLALLIRTESVLDSNDAEALSTFYEALENPEVLGWSGFNCGQGGVVCNFSLEPQRVIALALPGSGLRGTLAPEIGNMDLLEVIDLSDNFFYGQIPLLALEFLNILNLQGNAFTGAIPPMFDLSSLSYLFLNNNFLSGTLPDLSSLTGLNSLYLMGTNRLCPFSNYSSLAADTDFPGSTGCLSCECAGGTCQSSAGGYICTNCPSDRYGFFCEIVLQEEYTIDWAMINQYVDVNSKLYTELVTNVEWPLILEYPYVELGEVGFEGSAEMFQHSDVGPNCRSPIGAECLQVAYVEYYNLVACNFDGSHTLRFGIGCRLPFPSCPFVERFIRINLNVTSDDLCLSSNVTLAGERSISTFSDLNFTDPQVAFSPNQVAYFKVLLGTPVAFESALLWSVSVQYSRYTFPILSEGFPGPYHSSTNFDQHNTFEFSFNLTVGFEGALFSGPLEDPLIFFVEATYLVDYGLTEFEGGFRKRSDSTFTQQQKILLLP